MGQPVLDFSSALYLGLQHPWQKLSPWHQMTTGKPAFLEKPGISTLLAKHLANTQGLETGILGTSTLHIFLDLFTLFSSHNTIIYYDQFIYPIIRMGIDRANAKGIKTVSFRHHDPSSLIQCMHKYSHQLTIPIVATEGWCPHCGHPAPLPAYLNIIKKHNGLLIIDDTQAFGLLGYSPSSTLPYGHNGGGTLKWYNMHSHRIITVNSLAKAWGVPAAILSGNKQIIKCYKHNSETYIHSSPPSLAHMSATINALRENTLNGDARRKKLIQLVKYFRYKMHQNGIYPKGGIFPVQTIPFSNRRLVFEMHNYLLKNRIKTVITTDHSAKNPGLTFILSTGHKKQSIDFMTQLFQQYLQQHTITEAPS
ncbi:aminotransferase class I/II-fold pyridoxal phosphate-dependent enzyme [Marinilabiliaceae bacterium JC017]|nr:aminotransferase class I/II-fold pyridoxal phosphate-dependent enzyme [Marinilabiliaceae bacterium JC017]